MNLTLTLTFNITTVHQYAYRVPDLILELYYHVEGMLNFNGKHSETIK